jgi:hypothetical protein
LAYYLLFDCVVDQEILELNQRKEVNEMRKAAALYRLISILVFFVFALNPLSAFSQSRMFSKGSMFMTGQIESKSYVATATPFDSMPFPIGLSYEFLITDNIGIGSTFIYDKWCDYLEIRGGKFSFQIFKPSLDISYHFRIGKLKSFDFFSGANLGYTFLSVSNELGNDYPGDLKSEFYFAPFLGTHIYFSDDPSGFLGRFSVTLRAYWSVTGNYSGIKGAVGLTYKIK